MAVPARPVEGAPVDVTWGGVVHDAIVGLDIQYGQFTLTWSASSISDAPGVVFPRAFAGLPMVVCTVSNPTGAQQPRLVGGSGNVTATGFTFQGVETRETAVSASMRVQWIAIGPRA